MVNGRFRQPFVACGNRLVVKPCRDARISAAFDNGKPPTRLGK